VKAAVCREFGAPLTIEELVLREPHPDEVLVRVAATAVCHSDIHDINGDFGGGLPFVGGHETAGRVEEVGEAVDTVRPGDPVVVSLLESCGACRYCLTGRYSLERINEALESSARGEALRNVILFT
jgi:Zn-dependent alcohol dehydrogenase